MTSAWAPRHTAPTYHARGGEGRRRGRGRGRTEPRLPWPFWAKPPEGRSRWPWRATDLAACPGTSILASPGVGTPDIYVPERPAGRGGYEAGGPWGSQGPRKWGGPGTWSPRVCPGQCSGQIRSEHCSRPTQAGCPECIFGQSSDQHLSETIARLSTRVGDEDPYVTIRIRQ